MSNERTLIEVGNPYPAGTPPFPERNQYNYTSGAHMLLLSFTAPTRAEVASIERGPSEFAFVEIGDVIFLLYRFGSLPWQDAPYTFHLLNEQDGSRVLPEPQTGGHALLTTTLIDADTGIVLALRMLTWSAEFTAALADAIRRQAESPWCGEKAYDYQLSCVYAELTTEQLRRTATYHTMGGA